MSRALRVLPVLLATAVVAVTPATAYADPTWLPAVTASSADMDALDPKVVVDAQGNATALWQTGVLDEDTDELIEQVATATRMAGAADFGPVQTFPAGSRLGQLVTHPDGAVTLVFTVGSGLMATTRTPAGLAGQFPDPEPVSELPGEASWRKVTLVADGTGAVTALWVVEGVETFGIYAATRSPGTGDWSARQTVAEDLVTANAFVAGADGDGAVTLAWQQDNEVVAATRLPGTGSWHLQTVVDDVGSPFLDLAVTPAGGTALAVRTLGGPGRPLTLVRRPDPAAPFGDPAAPFAELGQVSELSVELDAAGRAIVAWIDGDGVVRSGAVEPGGRVTQAVVSPGHDTASALTSMIDARGAVILAWKQHVGSTYLLAARRNAGDGSFGPPVELTDPEQGTTRTPASLATDPEGDVTVVYDFQDNATQSRSLATSRVLDVAAPVLDTFAVPATGAVGATVALSAGASDRWSGPSALAWDFGDGTSATGASTSHVYAAPGSYAVRVTATDGAGNATTRTRTIVVTDATAPVLSGARLKPGRLPTGVGARLKVTSSENAALHARVQRKRDGAWRPVGTKRWFVQAGANDEQFYGRTAEQRLRSGHYRVLLTATDPAGNTSATSTLRFRVDRG